MTLSDTWWDQKALRLRLLRVPAAHAVQTARLLPGIAQIPHLHTAAPGQTYVAHSDTQHPGVSNAAKVTSHHWLGVFVEHCSGRVQSLRMHISL